MNAAAKCQPAQFPAGERGHGGRHTDRLPTRLPGIFVDPSSSKLNAFVHMGTDDMVTLFIHKAEMGQGTVTSLSSCWPKSWSATGKRSAPNSPA